MRNLLTPKWIAFHLLVVAAIVVMINLGFWQLRRLDERRAFNATVEARIDAATVALDSLVPPDAHVGDDVLADVEWRPVSVSGEYLAGDELRAYNRSQGGRTGDHVVTPLQLDDGRVVLVVRGFVPLGDDPQPPPTGEVDVAGRLRRSEGHRRGLATDAAEGELTEIRRIDIARVAPQLPGDVVPMYVELTSSRPAEAGPYPVPVPDPELSERNHLAYAIQWFVFSAMALIGWWLAVRRSMPPRGSEGPTEVPIIGP